MAMHELSKSIARIAWWVNFNLKIQNYYFYTKWKKNSQDFQGLSWKFPILLKIGVILEI